MVKKILCCLLGILIFGICACKTDEKRETEYQEYVIQTGYQLENEERVISYADGKLLLLKQEQEFIVSLYDINTGIKSQIYSQQQIPTLLTTDSFEDRVVFSQPYDNGTKDIYISMDGEVWEYNDYPINSTFARYLQGDMLFYVEPIVVDEYATELVLKIIDIDSKEEEIIDSVEYRIENGIRSGELFYEITGDFENVYYVIMKIGENGSLNYSETSNYCYNIKEKEIKKLPESQYQTLYLSGIKDYLIISEFYKEEYLEESGVIINRSDGSQSKIEGVTGITPIRSSYRYNNGLMFYTPKTVYYLNGENGNIDIIHNRTESEMICGFGKEGLIITTQENEKVIIKVINVDY